MAAPPLPSDPRRRWLARLLAVAFGLALLAVAEGSARLSGAALPSLPEGPLVATAAQGSATVVLERTPAGGVGVPLAQVQQRRMQAGSFAADPAPGVLRVFVYGGSAALGVPIESQPDRTLSGRLQAHLAARGQPAEVVTLAGASFGSAHVRQLVDQAAAAGPAIHLVWTGNNEFFNANIALYAAHADWTRRIEALEALHLLRLLRRALGRPAPEPSEGAAADQRSVVRAVLQTRLREAGAAALPDWSGPLPTRRDELALGVVEELQDNLTAAARAVGEAERGGVLAVVSTPANLLEPPWLSLHDPSLGRRARATHASRLAAAREAIEGGRCRPALPLLDEAIAIDRNHAEAWYLRGRCRLGQALASRDQSLLAQAERDLQTALELDMDPGRPQAPLRAVLEAVADDPAATGLDLGGLFGRDKTWGAALFADSCHLTATGQDAVARQLAGELAALVRERPDLVRAP